MNITRIEKEKTPDSYYCLCCLNFHIPEDYSYERHKEYTQTNRAEFEKKWNIRQEISKEVE